MKISKKLQETLSSISDDDITKTWNKLTSPNQHPLELWRRQINGEMEQAIRDNQPWLVIEKGLEFWKFYLENFDTCRSQSEADLYGGIELSAWFLCMELEEILDYHPELPYCSALISLNINPRKDHTKELVQRILDLLTAIRYGKPTSFTKKEKEEIKTNFIRFCNENQLPETLEKHFGEKSKSPSLQ